MKSINTNQLLVKTLISRNFCEKQWQQIVYFPHSDIWTINTFNSLIFCSYFIKTTPLSWKNLYCVGWEIPTTTKTSVLPNTKIIYQKLKAEMKNNWSLPLTIMIHPSGLQLSSFEYHQFWHTRVDGDVDIGTSQNTSISQKKCFWILNW